jgi:hypothetical protein
MDAHGKTSFFQSWIPCIMYIPYYTKYKICHQNLQLLGNTFTENVSLCTQLSGNSTWGNKKILISHLDKYGNSHLFSCSSVFSDSK